ncbi:DUF3800 domain-containing protein [Caldimonas tepidiphila]|uniref:DUF3800 domain-containing protein n=1 Tax=Caldimonas tepidiphila TaxID=2315841 RepID=UPI000E5B283D|nr:DUF3800 domain-containing protein [Caldimonas tepidiphila]
MTHHFAFIDESGNHDLEVEKSGASNYFIVLAIILRSEVIHSLEKAVESIRSKHFQKGEIKSSGVDDKRRLRIFEELKPLDYKFYAIAINKAAIHSIGLKHKKTFIKFCNGLLYRSLFQNFPELTIYADGHGGNEFIASFHNYLIENHQTDLFSNTNINIVDSKNNISVQLADFMVGSIARVYENRPPKFYREGILNFLKTKRIRIDEWPQRYEPYQSVRQNDNELDSLIYRAALTAASTFLQENENIPDNDIRKQCAALNYLLFRARFSSGREYISTQEIIEHVHGQGFTEISEHAMRSAIISKLRDSDVLIASSNKGYKIPTSQLDMLEFAEFVDGFTLPLLSRLNRAREALKYASAGEYDLLNQPQFQRLQRVIGAIES